MIKFLLSIVILTIALPAISQIDTVNKKICLTRNVVLSAIKDINRYDSCVEELKVASVNMFLCTATNNYKDSIIAENKIQLIAWKNMLDGMDARLHISEEKNRKINIAYYKLKIKSKIKTVGATVIIGILAFLVITNK